MSSTGVQQQPADCAQQPARDVAFTHGCTGEGSGSAMARLISQEQARIVPATLDETPDGSA